MTLSVGQRLRQARVEQGLDLNALAARTKISLKNLNAIEADDRSNFPSGFFYKSFVHQYARALSLDTREIDAEIDGMLSADPPLPLPGQFDPSTKLKVAPMAVARRGGKRRMFASLTVLAIVIGACSGFYAWWHKVQMPFDGHTPLSVEAAEKTTPAPVGEARQTIPQNMTKAPGATALPVSLQSSQPVPPIADPQAVDSDAASGKKVLLELVAREETWLAVSSDGRMVFKGKLEPHETKIVEGRKFAKLRVHNAAAVEVKFNGRQLDPLGGPGEFRVILFTPGKVQIVPEKQGD